MGKSNFKCMILALKNSLFWVILIILEILNILLFDIEISFTSIGFIGVLISFALAISEIVIKFKRIKKEQS